MIRFEQVYARIFFHSSMVTRFDTWRFFGDRRFIRTFNSYHRFSIGFKSRLIKGLNRTEIFFSWSHVVTDLCFRGMLRFIILLESKSPTLSYITVMNDEWRITHFFIKIYLSLFVDRGRIFCSMRQTDGGRRWLKDLETAILTLIFFWAALCHTHSTSS